MKILAYIYKTTTAICLLIASAFMLASCDETIHTYPKTAKLQLTVLLSADLSDPEHYYTVECDATNGPIVTRNGTRTVFDTRFAEDVNLRFIVELYRLDAGKPVFVERQIHFAEVGDPTPQATAVFTDVESCEYRVLCWTDYVQADVRESWYYTTDDLRNIRYSSEEVIDNNDKDVYSAVKDIDLYPYAYATGQHNVDVPVELLRPLGRYIVIAEDLNDFLLEGGNINNITTEVTYQQSVSNGYNVESQQPNDYVWTRTYTTKARVSDEGEMLMAYDYTFVNGGQSNVKINMIFRDENGAKISEWHDILIPMIRNHETLVIGRFLTSSYGTGGIGIDDNFEGPGYWIPVE